MAESDDGFLSRWSRRKEQAREGRPEEEPAATPVPAEPGAAPAEQPDEADIVATLPDIDSLDEASDFSVFMQKGVPEELRRLALRKLWRVNPLFNLRDGLNDYDLDYRSLGTAAREAVQTLYQVGQGMRGAQPAGQAARQAPQGAERETAAASGEAPAQAAAAADETTEPEGAAGEAQQPEQLGTAAKAGAAGQPEAARPDPDRPAESRLVAAPREPGPAAGDVVSSASGPKRGTAAARRWGRFST